MGSFNSDMDSYLSSRRKVRHVKVVKMDKPKKSFVEKFFNFFSGDEEEMDETQEVTQNMHTEANESNT